MERDCNNISDSLGLVCFSKYYFIGSICNLLVHVSLEEGKGYCSVM